ncbi:hypothetical protein A6E27_23045 [Bacillus cereus]|nr:hypothetical protein A6E27_23045 [Bacillus cereus]
MITVTVETVYGDRLELYFNDRQSYKSWRSLWNTYPNSKRIVHGWSRSIMFKSITRVIKVEEEN